METATGGTPTAKNTAPDLVDIIAGAIFDGDANVSAGRSWADVTRWSKEAVANDHISTSTRKVEKYRRIAGEVLAALGGIHQEMDNEPDEGHRFRITVESAGSYSTVGDEHHHDTEDWDDSPSIAKPVIVRAWNLRDALLIATGVPFHEFMELGDEDEEEPGACMETDPLIPTTGNRCGRDAGHPGKHRRVTLGGNQMEWSD